MSPLTNSLNSPTMHEQNHLYRRILRRSAIVLALGIVVFAGWYMFERFFAFRIPLTLIDYQHEDARGEFERLRRGVEKLAPHPDRVLAAYRRGGGKSLIDLTRLGVRSDSVIADIGSGTGSFEIYLLSSELPFGTLYGIDIDKNSLDFASFVLEQTHLSGREKVVFVHSEEDDLGLKEDSIDIALMALLCVPEAQPGVQYPTEGSPFVRSLRRAMKPNGLVHLIEESDECDIATAVQIFEANGFRAESCYFPSGECSFHSKGHVNTESIDSMPIDIQNFTLRRLISRPTFYVSFRLEE